MVDAQIQRQLITELERLPVEKQRQVLAFAHGLATTGLQGRPGSDLMPFFGILSPEEAQQMSDAIESGCEQVNPDDWKVPTF